MNEFLLAAIAALGAVAWAELRDWLPWASKHIVLKAVLALPESSRDRMEEELVAEVSAIPGKISPLLFACSVWWGLWRNNLLVRIDARATAVTMRGVDLLLASLLFTFVSPLILATSIFMKVAAGHGGLVARTCVGQNRSRFRLLAFSFYDRRTRKPTRWSRLATSAGIQYLPSLINVLRGEMSLVGPAPLCLRPTTCHLAHLKPGLVWLQRGNDQSLDGYGESTIATMRVYFKLLWSNVNRSLLE